MKKSTERHQTYFPKPVLLLAAVLGIQSAQAQFTFPVYEPFSEYTQDDRLRVAADTTANWNSGNSGSSTSSPIVSTNYAMSYPGLLPDPTVPAMGIMGAQGAGRTHVASITAQTSGTNYLSFLLSLSNLPSADRPIIGLNAASTGTLSPNSGPSVWITPSGQLKLDKGSSTAAQTNTTPPLALGSINLVVMAYKFPGTGEVDLWLNPTALGDNANVPAPTISITNGTSPTTLQSLCLYSGTGIALNTNLFDEIRVTTNWANATPASPSPGNVYNVSGGGSGCPGDTFNINLSGSDSSSVVYLLYTNGVFTGSSSNGTSAAFSFLPQSTTAVYTVLASNTVNGNVGWMNGNASISVLAGPSITVQPASVLVATNGYATFTVAATGNGLHYQWYKNGSGLTDGGHISGSATTVLAIFPATAADAVTVANGYYVIITNSCGLSATSTTNALTLQPAGNLVWQGGNPNTNWDFAITPNWTNSAGNSVVFNAGDKVTFDDSSTNQVVTLVGSVAPTSVIDNSSLNYFFNGSGSLVGTASLLMNGSGNLTISNANSYTGGTTISSGVLITKNQQAIGSGPITLAGGKLEVGLASGVATTGLTNINVTASSTIQNDFGGTFAINLLGTLNGSSGATLTFSGLLNNTAAPDRIRLYAAFTNNCPIVIDGSGDEMELAAYLTSGNQVYNGVISGTKGRLVPRGNGNLILNAANTFNDSFVSANGNGPSGYSVLLSSGNVGVGADSVSSSPPTIDSSPLGTGNLGIQVGSEGGTCSLFASGGAHTVGNEIIYTSATNTVTLVISGSNNLTLSGAFQLNGTDNTGGTNRTLQVNNTGLTTISGVIGDANLVCGLTKTGTNILVLSNVNTYTGPTTVSAGTLWVNGQIDVGGATVTNGTLGGSGTIVGPVTVQTPGTLAPGTSSLGTLTINNNLTLGGNAMFKVNKSLSPSNDVAVVSGILTNTGTGTLTVSNLGPALVVGDKFKLFSEAVSNGAAMTVTGAGMNWTNHLAVDGSIQVLSVASSIASYSTNISFSLSGSTLTISWPATHLGWLLQSQTNTLGAGLKTNWVDVAGSSGVTATNYTIIPANPAVFYRLRHP